MLGQYGKGKYIGRLFSSYITTMSHAEIESSGVNGKSLENGEKKAPFGTFKSGAPRIHLTRSTYADPL